MSTTTLGRVGKRWDVDGTSPIIYLRQDRYPATITTIPAEGTTLRFELTSSPVELVREGDEQVFWFVSPHGDSDQAIMDEIKSPITAIRAVGKGTLELKQ